MNDTCRLRWRSDRSGVEQKRKRPELSVPLVTPNRRNLQYLLEWSDPTLAAISAHAVVSSGA